PCATPSSRYSLDYRRSDARTVENGFATNGGLSKSAKVVLAKIANITPYLSWITGAREHFQQKRLIADLNIRLCKTGVAALGPMLRTKKPSTRHIASLRLRISPRKNCPKPLGVSRFLAILPG
ncbi:MAG: hypothetical protein P8Y71_11525, partial [Pseudolabrys sp.]